MHDSAQANIVEMIRLDKQASLTRGKQAPLRFGETRTSLVEAGVDWLEAYFVRFVGYVLEESGAMLLSTLITMLQVIISRHLGRCLFFLNKI